MSEPLRAPAASEDAAPFVSVTLSAPDGYPIAARRYDPPGEARAVAIVASAMGVKQSFYAEFAAWLARQGVVTWTFDYRGMGASRPAELRGFAADILDWAEKDAATVLEAAYAAGPALPILWLGHSVGAQILGLLPNRAHVSAMISVAAGSGYWRYNARPLRWYVLALWWAIMPVALRVAGYFPGKKLGAVGDLPAGVAEQWRSWCLHADYLGAEGDEVRRRVASTSVPIVALSMQDDELMTLRGTRELFRLYSGADVEIRRLRPAEVGVPAIGHFGFFRPNMERALWPLVTEVVEREVRRDAA